MKLLISDINWNLVGDYFISLAICLVAAKLLSVAILQGLRLYLERAIPGLRGAIDVKKNYTPWLFLFLLALMANKVTFATLVSLHANYIITVFTLISLYSGVMLCTRSIPLLKIAFQKYFDYSGLNNLKQRSISTQFQFIEKIFVITLWSSALVAALCSFREGRELAKSLLASAGVLGIVIGFAAQSSLRNLMAGFQIAFTQPIRLDDALLVEGQWGRVEKITLTYVVVCLWDLRRLVVPIHYFIEKPFENWTKTSSDLLPVVMLYVDFSLPVEPLRREFETILKSSPLWNQKAAAVQVTDLKEKTMEIRLLMSANNAPQAFDLRCIVRERIIAYLQQNYPDALPKSRFDNPELRPVEKQISTGATRSSNMPEQLHLKQAQGGEL